MQGRALAFVFLIGLSVSFWHVFSSRVFRSSWAGKPVSSYAAFLFSSAKRKLEQFGNNIVS